MNLLGRILDKLERRWMLVLPALLLLILVAGLFTVARRYVGANVLVNDAADYHNIAVGLLRDKAYHSAYRQPLFPSYLALIYLIFGIKPYAVLMSQAFLHAITMLFVWMIGRRVFKNNLVPLISLMLAAAFWPFYRGLGTLYSEAVSGLTIALFLLMFLKAEDAKSRKLALLAGMLLGLAALCKAVLLPFSVLAAFVLYRKLKDTNGLRIAALFLVGTFLVVFPWTVRNYIAYHKVIPISTGLGFNTWLGNYQGMYAERDWSVKDVPKPLAEKLKGKQYLGIASDPIFLQAALEDMKAHPLWTAKRMISKFFRLWVGWNTTKFSSTGKPLPRQNPLAVPILGGAMLLALYALLRMPGAWRSRGAIIWVLLAYWSLVHMVIVVTLRHGMPVYSYILMLDGFVLARVLASLGGTKLVQEE